MNAVDPRATPYTDAAPPGERAPIVVLGGAIKAWWETCPDCDDGDLPNGVRCPTCDGRGELWGGPLHRAYVDWRNDVRRRLIEARYLTYAPHEAFKGTWDERAQAINNAAIEHADAFLVLSPASIPSDGTDDEIRIAQAAGVPVVRWPPGRPLSALVDVLDGLLNESYWEDRIAKAAGRA